MLQVKRQVMPDGIAVIYSVANSGVAGGSFVADRTAKYNLRYQRRSVGVTRFFSAKSVGESADLVIRVPAAGAITTSDECGLGGKLYRINFAQLVEADGVNCYDLTLEEVSGLDRQ
jgi:hypothetical protein